MDESIRKRKSDGGDDGDRFYECEKCRKVYKSKYKMISHQKTCNGTSIKTTSVTRCFKCGRTYSTYNNRKKHEQICKSKQIQDVNKAVQVSTSSFPNDELDSHRQNQAGGSSSFNNDSSGRFSCRTCNSTFATPNELFRHENSTGHNEVGGSGGAQQKDNEAGGNGGARQTNKSKFIKCRTCRKTFENREELYHHRMTVHEHSKDILSSLQNYSVDDSSVLWTDEDGNIDHDLKKVYEQHKHIILRQKRSEGSVSSSFNFPVTNSLSLEELMNQIEEIFDSSEYAFKINLSFGIMLQHTETQRYRYFAPYYNESILTFPILVSRRSDLLRLREILQQLDVIDYCLRQRPDTKYKPVQICNVLYQVYKTSFPIGSNCSLPDYIVNKRCVISFQNKPGSKVRYNDNLCFFRCLAYHHRRKRHVERLAKELYTKWVDYCKSLKWRNFDVSMNRIPHVEKCFEVNINIYSLGDDQFAHVEYSSLNAYGEINGKEAMYLNIFQDHFSYIKSFKAYSRKFQCRFCEKCFVSAKNVSRHEKTCENTTKFMFPGGYFENSKTIFEKLDAIGIHVNNELRDYPWYMTFDMESLLCKVANINAAEQNTATVNMHTPISVAMCSNVDGYEDDKFILNSDEDLLLKEMIEYMNLVSDKAYTLSQSRWRTVFDEIAKLEQKWSVEKKNCQEEQIYIHDSVENDDGDDDNDDDDNDDDDIVGGEALETGDCEPVSKEMEHALSKENAYYRFQKLLNEENRFEVVYNHWENESDKSDSGSENSNADHDKMIRMDSESSDDCGVSQPFRHLDKNRIVSYSSHESDDDDNDDIIQPFRSLNKNVIVTSSSDNDDDDDIIQPFRPLNANRRRRISSDCSDDTLVYDVHDSDVGVETPKAVSKKLMHRLIVRTKDEFERYCHQLIVLGFNSGKYDLNLIKSKLALYLKLHEKGLKGHVIKRNNAYMCLANEKLRFLDIMNYLPPQTSYVKFLETFDVEQSKGYFPYEYMDSVAKLDETSLPPKEQFYSSLKQSNVLENTTFVKFERLVKNENKTEREALHILNLDSPPKSSVDENYNKLLKSWNENNMANMRDFLKFYNTLDVKPFLQGVKNFKSYFMDYGIDIFKDCVSVSGVAGRNLFNHSKKQNVRFALFTKQDEDMHNLIKQSLVGGPSIVFTRYHNVGETFIRNDQSRPCRSIEGYDMNALYLWAISCNMPTGDYVRRKEEDLFRPTLSNSRYRCMFDWMDWLSVLEGIDIKHKRNNGEEYRIGPYLIDGVDYESGILFEFYGCYYHQHECINWVEKGEPERKRYIRTMQRQNYLKDLGYSVRYIWECEYKNNLRDNIDMKIYVNNRYPKFYQSNLSSCTQDDIIAGVLKGELYGMLLVDIKVPESWEDVQFKPQTNLSPYEYFEEMSPLFCTTEIPFSCIGSHMQSHVVDHNLSKKSRQLLVGGMKADNLLLLSELLKWYIENGLQVTRIRQVLEYTPNKCFSEFVENITAARRQGDSDPRLAIMALIKKLEGNSSYGRTIINKEKYSVIKYVQGFTEACKKVNTTGFKSLVEISDDYFETELSQRRIRNDVPIQVGFTILNMAKLKLLDFYYSCLNRYVVRKDFELIQCDTDSLYMAFSGESLFKCIKPNLLTEFENNRSSWFTMNCCNKHSLYSMRTPGIMKLEYKGKKMIALCSKAYIANDFNSDKDLNHTCEKMNKKDHVKYSLKGVNKIFVNPIDHYENVLLSQETEMGVNRGIRLCGCNMISYCQKKNAFVYFYCKRKVLEDGIHTKPLDITLIPCKKEKA